MNANKSAAVVDVQLSALNYSKSKKTTAYSHTGPGAAFAVLCNDPAAPDVASYFALRVATACFDIFSPPSVPTAFQPSFFTMGPLHCDTFRLWAPPQPSSLSLRTLLSELCKHCALPRNWMVVFVEAATVFIAGAGEFKHFLSANDHQLRTLARATYDDGSFFVEYSTREAPAFSLVVSLTQTPVRDDEALMLVRLARALSSSSDEVTEAFVNKFARDDDFCVLSLVARRFLARSDALAPLLSPRSSGLRVLGHGTNKWKKLRTCFRTSDRMVGEDSSSEDDSSSGSSSSSNSGVYMQCATPAIEMENFADDLDL